jgi:hypothetical protein
MRQVFIEDLIAGAVRRVMEDLVQVAKIGELLDERECAEPNPLFDDLQVLTRAAQVGLRRHRF